MNAPAGTFNAIDLQLADTGRKQTVKLAEELLKTGMLKGSPDDDITVVVDKIATRAHYHSHGSVIDAREVAALGLKVKTYAQDDPLWKKVWLLRTMYQYDCGASGYSKLFESAKVSTAVAAPKSSPAPAP